MSLSKLDARTVGLGCAALVGAAASLALLARRRKQRETLAQHPAVSNVVEALRARGTGIARAKTALVSAGGAEVTWSGFLQASEAFARAVAQLRVASVDGRSLDGVAIHAFNCCEWFYAAMGAMMAHHTVSGIYNTNSYEQAAHILRTSDVRVLVIESTALYHSHYAVRLEEDFPNVLAVVIEAAGLQEQPGKVVSYESFVAGGKVDYSMDPRTEVINNQHIATLVYTSGTTGESKAVAITHDNLHSCVKMALAVVPLDAASRVVSYLPLSHIAAQAIDLYQALYSGSSVHFATKDALTGALKDTLLRVRPTLFFGVPRVYEKMRAAMLKAAAVKYAKPIVGPVLKAIGDAAKATAGAYHATESAAVRLALAPAYGLFRALLYRKVRAAMGLDRCSMLYTGAAPLRAETQLYFRSLGMPLLEVYGMSESTGCMVATSPSDPPRPMGSCGRCLPGAELRIAEDGEIVFRGPNVMKEYLKLPRDTADAVDAGGWLHSGDLGRLDERGHLFVTGRKKELLITEGGENVAPVPIEDLLLKCAELEGAGPKIGHVMVVGDQRKYLTCLFGAADGVSQADLAAHAPQLAAALRRYNEEYAKSRAQRVQKFIAVETFTVPGGELTATMKIRRAFVCTKYAQQINGLYPSAA